MKLLKLRLASVALTPNAPSARSPRQCIAPSLTRPRRVWVVIGPFIGWNTPTLPVPLNLPRNPNGFRSMISCAPRFTVIGLDLTTSSGLPRSHASSSLSPKMWQLAHAASPLPELWVASYSIGRPATIDAGSGLGIATDAVSARVLRSTTLTALSNRVATNIRWLASSSTRPLGPPPLTGM